MELKLPQRTGTHIAESRSMGLLQAIAPESWILREITERDYGIDCYIEICNKKNQLTGDLVLVQLKSKEKGFEWKTSPSGCYAKSHPIKTSTANYWMGLPVPVFLFEADLNAMDMYFVSIEKQIRRNYSKLTNQGSITFDVHKKNCLSSAPALLEFEQIYNDEKNHSNLAFHLTNFICQLGTLPEYVNQRQNYDAHMELEMLDFLQFRSIHETCRKAAEYLNYNWTLDSIDQLICKDQTTFSHREIMLHEYTLDIVLRELESLLPNLARNAIDLVLNVEAEYWHARDYALYSQFFSDEIQQYITYFESRIEK